MNIFDELSINRKNLEWKNLHEVSREFWDCAIEIRRELGENYFLFDTYLSKVLLSIYSPKLNTIFDKLEFPSDPLCVICRDICKIIEPPEERHSFTDIASRHILSNPAPFLEKETKLNLYISELFEYFFEFSVEQLIKELNNKIISNCLERDVKKSFDILRNIIGQEKLIYFNKLVQKKFCLFLDCNILLRFIENHLCYHLIMKDEETSKQIFQLILDRKNKKYATKAH